MRAGTQSLGPPMYLQGLARGLAHCTYTEIIVGGMNKSLKEAAAIIPLVTQSCLPRTYYVPGRRLSRWGYMYQ